MQSLRYEGPKATANMSLEYNQVADLIREVAELIRIAGEIPSGHLYAMLCGCMDLRSYNAVIAILKRTGMVRERSFLLTWVGPTKKD